MDAITKRREELMALVRKHFPYETPNPGQLESIVEIVRLFESGIRHVVLQAPTGIGKSVIAFVVHKVLREIDGDNRTTIITATKGLQDQYSSDFNEVFTLKGKTNYSCPIGSGPYNSGTCRSAVKRGRCRNKMKICPYVSARERWCGSAEVRNTNNSFMVESCPSVYQGREGDEFWAKTMIIDECHEIDDHIIEHTKMLFRVKDFWDHGEAGYSELIPAMQVLIATFKTVTVGEPFKLRKTQYDAMIALDKIVKTTHDDIEGKIEAAAAAKDQDFDYDFYGTMLENIQQIADKTSIFEEIEAGDYEKTEWIVSEYEDGQTVEIKSVYAHQVAHFALFRKAERFLHLSATICGGHAYARTLGLKDDEYAFLELGNPIPLDSRRAYVLGDFKLNASFSDWDGLTKAVDALATKHAGQNGIVHTVSFKLANEIFQRSKFKDKMLVSGDRQEIFNWLKLGDGRIVLSPSVEKGYDFKGDLARWQIVAKVPYLYLGDPFVKMNSEINPDWYARKAILRIVQACGRVTRGVNDYGVSYILDSNFKRLVSQNGAMFPSWFMDSLVMR